MSLPNQEGNLSNQAMTNKEFSSGGVLIRKINNDIEVLLIKDGYGHWTWPKGHIEKNETSEEAAIREIGEEVGFKSIRLIEKIREINYFYRAKGTLIFKTVYLYLFEHSGDEKVRVLTSEIQDAKWLSPAEALDTVEYKGAKEVLKKAIDRFKEVC